MLKNLTKYNKGDKIKEVRLKIHIIENDEYEEYNNKTNLRLITNNLESFNLREDDVEYNTNEYKNNINDKIMRQILKDKYQASIYLNDWLKIKPEYEIKPEDLEEVTESYITHNWSNKETDIVYKDKKYEGVFYLIEHQTKVDYLMAKRIREYKNEIENHYELNKQKSKDGNAKEKRIANVIAIVLYIEDKKWNAKRNIEEIKMPNPRVERKIEDDYALVSINGYSIEDLKKKLKQNNKNIILKLALINKISKIKEIEKIVKEIKDIKVEESEIDYIASYINERISKKISKDVANLMIKYIEDQFEKKEGKNMLEAFVDRILEEGEKIAKKGAIEGREKGIKEGRKEGREEGREEGISIVAINMLKEKCDKSMIKKCTGLSETKIAQLEKNLQQA